MATYTTNLSLKKPAQSDKVRIADFNNNADTIDAAIGAVGSKNLVGMVNALQDAAAIIANGDTHVAISSGDFVYVKNNTHGLSDGLYVASAAVSANGTVSDSNMTADSKGGLNALNGKFDTLLSTYIKSFTAIPSGQSTTYKAVSVDVSQTGYVPVSVGYSCGQAAINVYACYFESATSVYVGATNLNSTSVVSIKVVYLKVP